MLIAMNRVITSQEKVVEKILNFYVIPAKNVNRLIIEYLNINPISSKLIN